MPRSQRLPTLGPCLAACLALGLLLSACDPKPTATATSTSSPTAKAPEASAGQSGASPSGIKPADSGDKVDPTSAHKGPSEGGAATVPAAEN